MKKIFLTIFVFTFLFSLVLGQAVKDSLYQFKTITSVETTPVKNQGASGTCWNYSGSSFVETEILRLTGKLYDLSEMFTTYNTYMDKAGVYVRMHGKINFGQGGSLHDVTAMFKKYGAVPQSVYSGLNYGTTINKHGELDAVLKAMLDEVVKNHNKQLSTVWKEAYKGALEAYLGKFPEKFTFEGKEYTPKTFAAELKFNPDDYMQFTSWTDNPYYEEMIVLVPDNWLSGKSFNLPLHELEKVVDAALKSGYSVAWATDVSEKGFSWKSGVAIIPEKPFDDMTEDEKKAMFNGPANEMVITPELRQEAFDNYNTTDDHGMHIVGLATDKSGKEYYIVKNSWDTKNIFEGYLYVSKAFFKYKTISLMIHRDGVPKDLMKKLK